MAAWPRPQTIEAGDEEEAVALGEVHKRSAW